MLEKYNWYRKKNVEEKEDTDGKVHKKEKEKNGRWHHYSKRKPTISALEDEQSDSKEDPPKSVLFVQITCEGELASEIRNMAQSLRPWTKINIEVAERAGDKLQDLLCKSNPWDNVKCSRPNCFTCETAMRNEKIDLKNCR